MQKNWGEGIALRVRKTDYTAPSSTIGYYQNLQRPYSTKDYNDNNDNMRTIELLNDVIDKKQI